MCLMREHDEFEATDGSHTDAWSDWESPAAVSDAQIKATLASATHDIPCDKASIAVVPGTNTVEGCGQRVTYQVVAVEPQAIAGKRVHRRFMLIGRVPLAGSGATRASTQ